METTTMTGVGGHGAASCVLQVRVPAFAVLPRFKGGVRLIVDGDAAPAPPGPPLTD